MAQELALQRHAIMEILRSNDPEKKALLKEAEARKDLDPDVALLICDCRLEVANRVISALRAAQTNDPDLEQEILYLRRMLAQAEIKRRAGGWKPYEDLYWLRWIHKKNRRV